MFMGGTKTPDLKMSNTFTMKKEKTGRTSNINQNSSDGRSQSSYGHGSPASLGSPKGVERPKPTHFEKLLR
jgi:hypothetical protein